jgi:hypothetical protein
MKASTRGSVVVTEERDRKSVPSITISSGQLDAAARGEVRERTSRTRGRFKSRDLTHAVIGAIKAGLPVQLIEIELDNRKIRLQVKENDASENSASDGNDWADAK